MTVQELQKIIEKMEAESSGNELKIKMLEEYITKTLKAELPKYNPGLKIASNEELKEHT